MSANPVLVQAFEALTPDEMQSLRAHAEAGRALSNLRGNRMPP